MSALLSTCSLAEEETILSQVRVKPTLSVFFIGFAFSAVIFGITCCQAFYYYRSDHAKRDAWYVRVMVSSLLIISTAQEVLIAHFIYNYLVKNFSDLCALSKKVVWSFPAETLLTSLIELLVEGFLVYRTWRLGHNVYASGLCALCVLAAFAVTFVFPLKWLLLTDDLLDALDKLRAIGGSSSAVVMVADNITTITLLFYLHRGRTGFRRSDGLITKLVLTTVSTGALSSAVVLADFIAWRVSTRGFPMLLFNMLIGKVYVNSLLTTLNMRGHIKTFTPDVLSKGIPLSPLGVSGGTNSTSRGTNGVKVPLEVTIEHTVEVDERGEHQDGVVCEDNDQFVDDDSMQAYAREKAVNIV